MEHHDRLWYRRMFTVPAGWRGKNILLNFGAVDYETEVFLNGKSLGIHKGGYLPFSYDITGELHGAGPQEIIVRVYDPTESGGQPRGKQVTTPGGIMYTPTTGIWQTVWLEPVASLSIANLKIVPDVDAGMLKLTVNTSGDAKGSEVEIHVKDSGRVIRTFSGKPGAELDIPISNAKLWSPESPFLYDLDVTLTQGARPIDQVTSYFGMRKIAIADVDGIKKIFLNNKFVFEAGPLDQGFWPDGIYTAPTEAAMKSDIEQIKALGFNMVRKHIKVEPARWYYWTDKLGVLVWQDMPSANSYTGEQKVPVPPVDKEEYETELRGLVATLQNVPSIIMWVVFNEGQGQFDTQRLVGIVKQLDPTRLVNQASGGSYFGVGDILDRHSYPPPACPAPSATQALVCGEYGGIGYFVKGHTWTNRGGGYTGVYSGDDLVYLYADFYTLVKKFRDEQGLSAVIYTELTDVMTELNGFLTYDRVPKVNFADIARINRFEFSEPTYRAVLPTSETDAQTWKFTTEKPAGNWNKKNFDDSTWSEGKAGFGKIGRMGNTPWKTSDIWMRKSFNPGSLTPKQIDSLVVKDLHDDGIDVFINGVSAFSDGHFIGQYEYRGIKPEARAAIAPDAENLIAVHCHQKAGGQYIDVGLYERIPGSSATP
jgi:hypothetical protein